MNLLTQKVVVMSHFHLKIKQNEKREKEEKKSETFSSENCSNKQNIIVRKNCKYF